MSTIAEKVKKIVVDQLAVPEDQVTDDARFVEDLNADSLDLVELIMALEEEFSADIPDDDAEKLKTVGDVIKYVEDKKVAKAKEAKAEVEVKVDAKVVKDVKVQEKGE